MGTAALGDASGIKRVDPADIRLALRAILRSETFARSERSRELLKYIVERDLDGESDRLKGFAIALDVFGREDNFDPSTDAVVRVQAGRLRDLLETYYAGEGAKDAVRVTVPRGSYVPAYELVLHVPPLAEDIEDGLLPESAALAVAPPSAMPPVAHHDGVIYVNSRTFWSVVAAVTVTMLAMTGLLISNYMTSHANRLAQQQLAEAVEPRRLSASEALPSISLMPDVPEPLRSAFEDAIPRFGSVVYRTDRSVTVDHPLADFYIETVPSGKFSYAIQFFERRTGILLGTDHIPGGLTEEQLSDQMARVTSRFLPVGGVIYAFLESNAQLNPLTLCLSEGAAYFNDQTPQRHEAAYRCHEKLIDNDVISALSYSELSSLTIETFTDNYTYPPNATLDGAVAMARRAVELAPNSAQAHRALSRALLAVGESSASLNEIREAYALNKYDLGIAASYGNTLVATGDFDNATNILERATKSMPVHPTWWDFALFVASFQQGRRDLVTSSANNLVGHNRPHYCAARLIAAYLDGDEAMRQKMLADLREEEDAVFVDNPLAYYQRIMPKDAAEKLVAMLTKAGLKPARANEEADVEKPTPYGG